MRIEDILVLELCKRKKNRGIIEDILQNSKINIDSFLSRIDRHLIRPFILNELVRYAMPEQMKTRITAAAREAVLEAVLRNQMLKKEYSMIQKILEHHGIECVLLKGLSLDFSGIRTVGDLDILVREKDLLAADKLVPLAGYDYVGDILNLLIKKNERKDISRQLAWNNQFQYHNTKNALLLELHINFFERSRGYKFDLGSLLDSINAFWDRKKWNGKLGTYVLCNEDLLLLMCLHTALKRAPYANQFVLRNLLDIAGLVEEGIDWDRIVAESIALNVSSFVLFALTLTARLLDVEVPEKILHDLHDHCLPGEKFSNAIHLRCLHDLGASRLFYSNFYKLLIPFVYQKKWLPRIKSILLLDLLFPPKRTMARFFKLKADNPLIYATYLLNPLRWLYLIAKRIIFPF